MEKIRFKLVDKTAIEPRKASDGDIGWDIRAFTDHTIPPNGIVNVRTGIIFDVPVGWELKAENKKRLTPETRFNIIGETGSLSNEEPEEFYVTIHNMNNGTKVLRHQEIFAQITMRKINDFSFEEVTEFKKELHSKKKEKLE